MVERGITVLGATGFTGRLISRELVRRGVRPLLAGRNADKLRALSSELAQAETCIADVQDQQSLAAMAQQSRVIVNCAGPFIDYGPPVVEAALTHGAHYLDTTGEQPFMKAMLEHDEQARAGGVAIVSAQAFEIAVADCGAAIAAAGLQDIAALQVVYSAVFHASQGTQRSIMRMLESPGFAYRHGEWEDDFPGSRRPTLNLPEPFGRCRALSVPAAEIVTIPRHLQLREVEVYFVLPPRIAAVAAFALPWLRRLARSPLRSLLKKMVGDGTGGPDEATRKADQFHILIDVRGVRDGNATQQRMLISGVDPYGLTAVIAASAALRMNDPAYARSGVLPPAQAFDPHEVLQDCAAAGLQWQMLASGFDLETHRSDHLVRV